MTAAFLAALGLERITAQTFADAEGGNLRPQIMHGPHFALERRLRELNEGGAGIFTMVNSGDLRGRRAENVKGITAYFADLDGAPLLDEYPLEPTAIVESSRERYHLYWRVTGAPLTDFGHVQGHVAALLGSDPKVIDLPRVMRLPGYLHKKGSPFLSRTLSLEPRNTYAHADFLDSFGVPEPVRARALPQAVQDYITSIVGNGKRPQGSRETLVDRVASAGSGARNDTLFRVAAALANDVASGELDRDTMEAELSAAAAMSGLGEIETARTIRSALRYAVSN